MSASTTLTAKVGADTSEFRRGMAQANSSLEGLRRTAGGLRNIVIGVGLGAGAKSATSFLGEALKLSSDFNETASKTGLIFGRSTEEIKAWAKTTSASLITSQTAILDTASSFAGLLENKGVLGKQRDEFAKRLTERSADLASQFNTSQQDAADAIASALRGEADPIERYNVSLNDATLKAEAFRLGMYKGKGVLDDTAKAQAAYNIILRQTARAEGDINRTGGGYANQVRALQNNVNSLKKGIGDVFRPLAERWLPKVNKLLSGLLTEEKIRRFQLEVFAVGLRFERWVKSLGDVRSGFKEFLSSAGEWGTTLGPALKGVGEFLMTAMSALNSLSPETKANIGLLVAAGVALRVVTKGNPVVRLGVSLTGEAMKGAASAFGSFVFNKLFDRTQDVWVKNWPSDFETDVDGSGRRRSSNRSPGGAGRFRGLKGLGAAGAVALAAEMLGVTNLIPESWSFGGTSVRDRTSTALGYAGTGGLVGAVIGSVIPVVGTAVGSAVGTAIGGVYGFFKPEIEKLWARLKGDGLTFKQRLDALDADRRGTAAEVDSRFRRTEGTVAVHGGDIDRTRGIVELQERRRRREMSAVEAKLAKDKVLIARERFLREAAEDFIRRRDEFYGDRFRQIEDRLRTQRTGIGPQANKPVPLSLYADAGAGGLGRIVPTPRPPRERSEVNVSVLLDGRAIAKYTDRGTRPMSGPRLSLIGA